MDQTRSIDALLVEDSPEDAELLLCELRRRYVVSWRRVDSAEALRRALHAQSWDIIFSDYTLPGFDGLEALRIVQTSGMDVPVVFVSGTVGEEIAVHAMKSGAADYLMKDNLLRLLPLVERELQEAAGRRERRVAERRLFYLAHHDSLTGLPNRVLLGEQLIQRMAEPDSRRHGHVAVVLLDIDRFKTINDSFGHDTGDLLLQHVGSRLRVAFPDPCLVACFGGDEFVLVVPELHGTDAAERLLTRLHELFEMPFELMGRSLHVHVSAGAALYPDHADTPRDLLRYADIAMCRAKGLGGARGCVYVAEMSQRVTQRLAIEHALQHALDISELKLAYQPQLDLRTGTVTGAEALLRWSNTELGTLSPASFIPVAEECGLIVPAGLWVLGEACREAQRWHAAGLGEMRIAVNASAVQLQLGHFAGDVLRILAESGLPPERLEIEITETALMADPDSALSALCALRDAGISIALDDFGTGYSSLSYLKRFPVSTLKIDRSFIRDIPTDADDMAIVSAIIAMAHRLKIDVLAEAVETPQQLEFLIGEGCDLVQGFHLYKPMPGHEVVIALRGERTEPSARRAPLGWR